MSNKPKTRAEEIAFSVGRDDGRRGINECPYLTAQYAQCWRDGRAQARPNWKAGVK